MRTPLHFLLMVSYLSFTLALDLPLKPKNLQCVALQEGRKVSPKLTCHWDPGKKHPHPATSYTLYAHYREETFSVVSYEPLASNLTLDLGTFPIYMKMKVWVEVKNEQWSVNSTELCTNAESFVKTNPPSNVTLIPEPNVSTSLIVNWNNTIQKGPLKLRFNIRYCHAGSSVWTEVPQNYTKMYVESYRLQFLQPYTDYVVQMRCINQKNIGFWSDWSPNATVRTPEAQPESMPDLWRVYDENNETLVKLIWKDPVKSNGKILVYDITVEGNGKDPERYSLNSKEQQLHIKGEQIFIKLTANNSVGISPMAALVIPRHGKELRVGVENVSWWVRDEQLCLDWFQPSRSLFEFLLEWVSDPDGKRDWQRVSAQATTSSYSVCLKDLSPFTRYRISVYPIYQDGMMFHLPGKQVSVEAYLQQAPPLRGPSVEASATQKNSVHLKWEEIPVASQRGFLTHYTIFYKSGDNEQFVVVGSNFHSYKLTKLASGSRYEVHIMASNMEGSVNGSVYSFYTRTYDNDEITMMVVLVCLGFLFFLIIISTISLKKRELIQKQFFPPIPNPSHSTIAKWSPDKTTRVNTPKEDMLPDVSMVEVDMFDGTSLFEEDKTELPRKKDTSFSQDVSEDGGIGGSSCKSSPRQSMSDSDEGDSCQTTASTVQYSSVVASGYKGQTPSLQAPVFTRSESTQPLLDSEEHPEHLLEGSGHRRSTYFRRGRGLQQLHMQAGESNYICLNFSPTMEKENTPTSMEAPPTFHYMPQ